jgi:hypothetical protein
MHRIRDGLVFPSFPKRVAQPHLLQQGGLKPLDRRADSRMKLLWSVKNEQGGSSGSGSCGTKQRS